MPDSSPQLQSVPLVPTRWCPTCRDYLLEPVTGGLGKMGCCIGCGYSGPLEIDPPAATRVAATRRRQGREKLDRIARLRQPSRDNTPARRERAYAPARRRVSRARSPGGRAAPDLDKRRPPECP